MLIAFPIAAFLLILVIVIAVRDRVDQGSFLIASALWGTMVAISTEALSLFSTITRPWVAVFWISATLVLLGVGLARGTFRRGTAAMRAIRLEFEPFDRVILSGLGLLLGVLALVAWLSPPNNTDSLLYHMPRIAHWIQNSSLRHYPTGYQHQLWTAPFAEFTILHLKVLGGSDQPVNLVQWFSLLGSMIALSGITQLLGADRRGLWLTLGFAFSIPMAILQSTSTQTDLVTAFWLLCLTYFVVLSKTKDLTRLEWFSLAVSAGLGVLTKATFALFAAPLVVWFFTPKLRKADLQSMLTQGLALLAVIVGLNLGHWGRNWLSYANPLGPNDAVSDHADLVLHPINWLSKAIKQSARNFATPWPGINARVVSAVGTIDRFLGIDEGDFQLTWAWNHEDLAGSPVHVIAVVAALIALIAFSKRRDTAHIMGYALVVLTSFLIFASVTRFLSFILRLQLPVLLLSAPLVGLAVTSPAVQKTLAATFLALGLPWLLFNSTRPIIAMRPDPEPLGIPCLSVCTRASSIFKSTEIDLLFANWPALRQPVLDASRVINDSSCREVGLQLDSHDKEYFFWSTLNPDTRIETIYTFPALERYRDPAFQPCAVICTICGDRNTAYGLDRVGEFDGVSVYMGGQFSVDVDS